MFGGGRKSVASPTTPNPVARLAPSPLILDYTAQSAPATVRDTVEGLISKVTPKATVPASGFVLRPVPPALTLSNDAGASKIAAPNAGDSAPDSKEDSEANSPFGGLGSPDPRKELAGFYLSPPNSDSTRNRRNTAPPFSAPIGLHTTVTPFRTPLASPVTAQYIAGLETSRQAGAETARAAGDQRAKEAATVVAESKAELAHHSSGPVLGASV